MNKLLFTAFKSTSRRRFNATTLRLFSTENMSKIVNNFYTRAEAEEVTIAGVARTMGDMLKLQNITIQEY